MCPLLPASADFLADARFVSAGWLAVTFCGGTLLCHDSQGVRSENSMAPWGMESGDSA